MEGFVPDKYDEVLGLKKRNLHAVVQAAAGHRAMDDKYAALNKVRFERSELIEHI